MDALTNSVNSINNETRSADQEPRPACPLVAAIDASTGCNSKCIYCQRRDHEIADLPLSDLILAVDELDALGVPMIVLGGGEPLLNQELEQIITQIQERRMVASLITNGLLLSSERLRALRDAGLNSVTLSLDTLDPQVYTALRGVSIEPVIRGLDCISQETQVCPEFKSTVNCVISKMNIDRIVPLVEYCSERGVFVEFQPLHASSGTNTESTIVFGEQDLASLNALIDRLLRMQQEGYLIRSDPAYLQGFAEFLVYWRLPPGFVCLAGHTTISVDPNLDVISCWSMQPVGNLRNSRLVDLWHSEGYSNLRDAMMKLKCPKCWLRCHTAWTLV